MYKWLQRRVPGTNRFGRRKLVLVHCGSVWLLTGWAVMVDPIERFSRPGPGAELQFLDSPHWGVMWIAGGIFAFVNAIVRKHIDGRDVFGYAGIVTPPFVWLIFYLWSAALHLFSRGELGNSRAPLGALTWYLISAFVLIVAGWPDPDDPDITHPNGDGVHET